MFPRAFGACLLLTCAARAWGGQVLPLYIESAVLDLYEDPILPPGMVRAQQRVPCPGADILRHPTEAGALLIAYCPPGESKKFEFAILPDELGVEPRTGALIPVLPKWERVQRVLQAELHLPEDLPPGPRPTALAVHTLTPSRFWLRVATGPSWWIHQKPAASMLLGAGMTWHWVHRPGVPGPLSGLRSTLDVGLALRTDLPHDSLQSELARFSRVSLGLGVYGNLTLSSRAPLRFVVGSEVGVGLQQLWSPPERLSAWRQEQDAPIINGPYAAFTQYIPEWTVLAFGPSWEPRGMNGVGAELLLRWRTDVASRPQSAPDNSNFRTDWFSFTLSLSLRWSPYRRAEVEPVTRQTDDLDPVPDDDPAAVLLDLE